MREIKFRAWDKERKEFAVIGFELFNFVLDGIYSERTDIGQPNLRWFGDKDIYDFQQYTGLKDKNGIEIYEGDIVKTKWQHDGVTNFDYYLISEIVWHQDSVSFCLLDVKEKTYFPMCSFEREELLEDGVEVIGNIYENE